jgi:hypothetical protein
MTRVALAGRDRRGDLAFPPSLAAGVDPFVTPFSMAPGASRHFQRGWATHPSAVYGSLQRSAIRVESHSSRRCEVTL